MRIKRGNQDLEESRINRKWKDGRRTRDEIKPIHHGNRNVITILPFQHIYMYYFFVLYDSLQWVTFTKNHSHRFYISTKNCQKMLAHCSHIIAHGSLLTAHILARPIGVCIALWFKSNFQLIISEKARQSNCQHLNDVGNNTKHVTTIKGSHTLLR